MNHFLANVQRENTEKIEKLKVQEVENQRKLSFMKN